MKQISFLHFFTFFCLFSATQQAQVLHYNANSGLCVVAPNYINNSKTNNLTAGWTHIIDANDIH